MKVGRYRSAAAEAAFREVYQRGMAALPTPSAIRDIPTAFGTVRCYRFGAEHGEPLVLLHGRAGSTVMWQPNLAELAARRPVLALDVLGDPGASVQTAPLRGGADQAAWLTEVLDALDEPRVHLVGYSFGGWLAANQAIRAPARLATITLIDPVRVFGDFPPMLLLRTALTTVPVISRWARPAFMRWISGGAEVPADDPVAAVIDAGIRDFVPALPTPEHPSPAQLRTIELPALVLIGGRSVIHRPEAAAARARATLPAGTVEVWPDATHAIAGESPGAVDDRVLRFVADQVPR